MRPYQIQIFLLSFCANVGIVLDYKAFGGVERQTENLARNLARRPELNVTLFVYGNLRGFRERLGVQDDVYALVGVEESNTLRWIEKKYPVDVFIINQPHVLEQSLLGKRRTVGAVIVYAHHGQSFYGLWNMQMLWELCTRVEAVVVLSRVDVRYLKSLGLTQVVFIPNFIPFQHSEPRDLSYLLDASAKQATRIVLPGRIGMEKRQDVALHVLAKVIKLIPGASLTFAGGVASDGMIYALMKHIGEKKLENATKIVGDIRNLTALYQGTDIALLTSPDEGYPLVLSEAAFYGVPVAMFRIGQLENAAGTVMATQFDVDALAEAVAELLASPQTRYDAAVKGRLQLEKNTPSHITDKWAALIDALLCRENCTQIPEETVGTLKYEAVMWSARQRLLNGWSPALGE